MVVGVEVVEVGVVSSGGSGSSSGSSSGGRSNGAVEVVVVG